MKLKVDIITNDNTNTKVTQALLTLLSKYENIINNVSVKNKDN